VHITNIAAQPDGWTRFNLNVGGFTIRNCRWNPAAGQVLFPLRYSQRGGRHRVIRVYGRTVLALRTMLEQGIAKAPRDRRPCVLRIHRLHRSHWTDWGWYIFDFTVRGFTILGCRWHPDSGSIQLPVTFLPFDERTADYPMKRVICSWGPHINRLRRALEDRFYGPADQGDHQALDAELAAS